MSKNRKCSVKAIALHVLMIVWMVAIFCFSAQPGEESADLSGSFTYLLVDAWDKLFHLDWTESKRLEYAAFLEYPIRKAAHMTEFGILALFSHGAIRTYEKYSNKMHYLLALLITFGYAVTDEIHQLFVPNRYGCFTDVLVDTIAALLALCIIYGIFRKKSNK